MTGEVEAGPNAVLAWARHGYDPHPCRCGTRRRPSPTPGSGVPAARHWRTGAYEWRRSLSKRLFARDLRRLVPDIAEADLRPGGCGIRAQAVFADLALADDFVSRASTPSTCSTPSPGATASAAIGRYVAERVEAAD
ncbi:MAG: hypothetical protein R2991_16480 [Thermoanaerobaculia bacterium]